MKSIYEIDEFNKALDFIAHERTNNIDFHIFRLETNKKKDEDIIVPLHRQHFMDITLFVQASRQFDVYFDNEQQRISNYTLQMVPPFKLLAFNIPKEELKYIKGYTLLFNFDFLSVGFSRPDFLNDFSFFKLSTEISHFTLSTHQAEKFALLFETMLYEYENNLHRSKQILQGYLWVLLNECKKVYDTPQLPELKESIPRQNQPQRLFDAFQSLVANNIHSAYAVDDYAKMLHISTNHLTQSTKEVSGKTPKQFITERRIVEAKCLLQYSNNSVAEIAYLLNFSEPTHFVKFFKKETGFTPLQFRVDHSIVKD